MGSFPCTQKGAATADVAIAILFVIQRWRKPLIDFVKMFGIVFLDNLREKGGKKIRKGDRLQRWRE